MVEKDGNMTRAAINSMTEKPAVVVVGDVELSRVCGAPAGPNGAGMEMVAVEDYLEALGEMSHRRVAVVVGRLEPMRHSMEQTVRAMREIGGDARLLLVVGASEEPEARRAVRLGVDDYFVEPLRGGELEEAIGGGIRNSKIEIRNGEELTAKCAKSAKEGRGGEGGVEKREAEESEMRIVVDAVAVKQGLDAMGGQGLTPGERGSDAKPQAAGVDGEAGLMERVIGEKGSIREMLIGMLREKLGGDIAWSGQPAVGRLSDAACVALWWKDQSLGYLVSDEVDRVKLGEHAGWAARWLALENHVERLRHEANHDELTGAWNRRYFEMFLNSILRRARDERFRVTVLVFDIDDFKKYNDTYGHAAGDDILREAVRLMQTVVRKHDVVARIGGDEFAVIFWDADPPRSQGLAEHPHSPRKIAARFQKAICDHCFPKLGDLAPGTLTISGGLASYPWDGQTGEELLKIADDMLLKGKGAGKNLIMLGPGAERVCGNEELNPG